VKANQAELPVRSQCETLRVSTSGYYDWLGRGPSARTQANITLLQSIRDAHAASDQTYGMPRIRAELADMGIVASRKRIARLMHDNHLCGVSRRRGWCVTTERNPRQRPAPDLVERKFVASDINQLWVADMTYVPTWEGFLYLAVVTDVFSRKVVGWAFGVQMTSDLVIAALDMALFTRKPEGVIHHSDQGSQYTSIAFGKRCKEMNVRPSMGTVGDAYDNAMAESFFATLEHGASGRPRREPGWRFLPGSRLGTTHDGVILAWVRCHPTTLKNCNRRNSKLQQKPKSQNHQHLVQNTG